MTQRFTVKFLSHNRGNGKELSGNPGEMNTEVMGPPN
jgi:hypothetical protein